MDEQTMVNTVTTPEVVTLDSKPVSAVPTQIKTVTNISEEEFKKRVEAFEQKRKELQVEAQRASTCPVCAARKNREQYMWRMENDLISMLRTVSVVSLDSCILCVQKHVSRAMTYYEELLTAKDSGNKDGIASVNVKINHLKILGHLGCAIEESNDYTELNKMLIDYERAYRYEGIGPDWQKLAEQILAVEAKMKAEQDVKDRAKTAVKI